MRSIIVSNKHSENHVSWMALLGRKLKKQISDLFRPEVVEVTFKVDGNNVTYTYTKVEEKRVA